MNCQPIPTNKLGTSAILALNFGPLYHITDISHTNLYALYSWEYYGRFHRSWLSLPHCYSWKKKGRKDQNGRCLDNFFLYASLTRFFPLSFFLLKMGKRRISRHTSQAGNCPVLVLITPLSREKVSVQNAVGNSNRRTVQTRNSFSSSLATLAVYFSWVCTFLAWSNLALSRAGVCCWRCV